MAEVPGSSAWTSSSSDKCIINSGQQGDVVNGIGGDVIKNVGGDVIKHIHVYDNNISDEERILLPRFVVLKSECRKCLRLTENDGSLPARFLKFDESEEVSDEQLKFELEPTKSERGKRLVHLRCCYNNKYLVIPGTFGTSCASCWIVAPTDKPEEDKSKISCTLFKLEPINISQGLFRFRHVHLGIHACLWTCSNKAHSRFLRGLHGDLGALDEDEFNVFTVVDWNVYVQ